MRRFPNALRGDTIVHEVGIWHLTGNDYKSFRPINRNTPPRAIGKKSIGAAEDWVKIIYS